jgi:hypothetical protein
MDVAGCFSSIQATEACDTHELTLQQPTLSDPIVLLFVKQANSIRGGSASITNRTSAECRCMLRTVRRCETCNVISSKSYLFVLLFSLQRPLGLGNMAATEKRSSKESIGIFYVICSIFALFDSLSYHTSRFTSGLLGG